MLHKKPLRVAWLPEQKRTYTILQIQTLCPYKYLTYFRNITVGKKPQKEGH